MWLLEIIIVFNICCNIVCIFYLILQKKNLGKKLHENFQWIIKKFPPKKETAHFF